MALLNTAIQNEAAVQGAAASANSGHNKEITWWHKLHHKTHKR